MTGRGISLILEAVGVAGICYGISLWSVAGAIIAAGCWVIGVAATLEESE